MRPSRYWSFRHNIVKVAVDPRGDSRVPNYFDNVTTKFLVNNRTDALQTDINLFFYDNKLTNGNFPLSLADVPHEFQIHASVRILTIKIIQWFRAVVIVKYKMTFSNLHRSLRITTQDTQLFYTCF